MKNEDHNLSDKDFREIASLSKGFSGSDINSLIKSACYEPLWKF